ncbi:SRPBCC family protein [Rhodococcus sp. NPDC058521]|uniref:SRPBCC family protein n=1 Tax=Rhodococcus sp. NPDC058521 TaxID=3346536 RepID=UPI003660DEFD
MSSIQVADQTFVAAPPERVARALGSPSRWRRWWPDLQVKVGEDRGEKGIRWTVDGPLVGTMEVWLEPALDGVIIHYFLHAEPASEQSRANLDLAALNRERRVQGKGMSFEVKKELEHGRPAGEAPR